VQLPPTGWAGLVPGGCPSHKKVILYANPGKEGFYAGLGFLPMNTAMAIWRDPAAAVASGLLRAAPD
jgi:hypothetical protein